MTRETISAVVGGSGDVPESLPVKQRSCLGGVEGQRSGWKARAEFCPWRYYQIFPRLPAAALNQRYGLSVPRRCISPIPAPQTGISNVSIPWEGEPLAEPQTQPTAARPAVSASASPILPAHRRTLPASHRNPETLGETAATEPLNWLK